MEPALLQSLVLVAIGGAAGAVLRFGMGQAIDSSQFPWATFAVNIIGSFCLALLMFGWPDISPVWRVLLFTGLFGAFTTMSTFSLEAVDLASRGAWLGAVGYVALTCVLCVSASYVGGAVVRG
jgi:CrcB protein